MGLINVLQQHPPVFFLLVGVLSLLFGSFLNVVIYRLPIMMQREWRADCLEFLALPDTQKTNDTLSLSWPHSHCPHCKTALKFWHNIPLLSYLVLRGRCAYCQQAIPARYPLIELTTALLCFSVAWTFGFSIQTLLAIILTCGLISSSVIDYDHQFIPDLITLPLLWIGLLANLYDTFTSIDSAVYGAVIGYVSLWSFAKIFELLTGRVGMGHGDFKLFALFGAWMGWQLLPLILIAASVVGSIVGIGLMIVQNADRQTQIPFGPFLATAAWIALLFGHDILNAYLNFVGMPAVML